MVEFRPLPVRLVGYAMALVVIYLVHETSLPFSAKLVVEFCLIVLAVTVFGIKRWDRG